MQRQGDALNHRAIVRPLRPKKPPTGIEGGWRWVPWRPCFRRPFHSENEVAHLALLCLEVKDPFDSSGLISPKHPQLRLIQFSLLAPNVCRHRLFIPALIPEVQIRGRRYHALDTAFLCSMDSLMAFSRIAFTPAGCSGRVGMASNGLDGIPNSCGNMYIGKSPVGSTPLVGELLTY